MLFAVIMVEIDMAILIPSKNIYDNKDQKVIDNVIERIEVGAFSILTKKSYEEIICNETINVDGVLEKKAEDFNPTTHYISGSSYAVTAPYSFLSLKFLTINIRINKASNNKFIDKVIVGVDEDNKPYITCSVIGDKKKGTAFATITANSKDDISMGDISFKSDVVIEENVRYAPSDLKLEIETTAETSVFSSQSIARPDNISSIGNNNIIIEYGNYYELMFTVLVGTKSYSLKGAGTWDYIGGLSFSDILGEYKEEIPKKVEVQIYGDTIGIDLQDKIVYVNGETSEKVHSFEGNELMQITNYIATYSYEEVGDMKFTGRSATYDDKFSIEITTNLNLAIGEKYYYLGDEIYVVNGTNDGYEVWVVYDGEVYNAYNNNNNATIKVSKKNVVENLSIVPNFKKTIGLYKNGKETVTIRCSISDYFDYESKEKVIAIDNLTGKMRFEIYDQVIPMVYGADGKDHPISTYKDRSPKVFQVLGSNIFYDGAVWQELSLQEIDYINGEIEPEEDKILTAPTISIDGSTLTITPMDERTEVFAIYVDNVGMALVANSEDIETPNDLAEISGTWRFKDGINSMNIPNQSVLFNSYGLIFTKIEKAIKDYEDVLYVNDNDATACVAYRNNELNDEGYRTITFYGTQTVSKEFYDFILENAVRQDITFKIGSNEYKALKDMTWIEWLGSEYNIDNFMFYDNKIVNLEKYYVAESEQIDGINYFVSSGDTIKENYLYILTQR